MSTHVTKENLQEFASKFHAKNKTLFALKSQTGTPPVVTTAASMTDQTKIYVYMGTETGYIKGGWYYYSGSAWTFGGMYNSGDWIGDDLKQALLQLASKVAYIDDDGQDYYDALESALYHDAALVSISAVYTQSGTVYDTDSLESLKSDLVVTALYSDATTATVTAYTLSGTLTKGTSTITVAYGDKTATFDVEVVKNTTAKIATSGKYLTYVSGSLTTKTSAKAGITQKYLLDSPPSSVLHPVGIIPTDAPANKTLSKDNNLACMFIYNEDGTPAYSTAYVTELMSTGFVRWVQNIAGTMTEYSNSWSTSSPYYQIAFSVDTRYLDDAYMYDGETGQVFFAGINTPYFGMDNISEASA